MAGSSRSATPTSFARVSPPLRPPPVPPSRVSLSTVTDVLPGLCSRSRCRLPTCGSPRTEVRPALRLSSSARSLRPVRCRHRRSRCEALSERPMHRCGLQRVRVALPKASAKRRRDRCARSARLATYETPQGKLRRPRQLTNRFRHSRLRSLRLQRPQRQRWSARRPNLF